MFLIQWKGKPLSNRSSALRVLLTFSALILPQASCFAAALDHRLMGAWTPSAFDCAKIFEMRAGQIRFRQPVDQFTSAFIIGPQKIIGPGGQCRNGKASQAANVITMDLDCHNAISYSPQRSQITIVSNTEFKYDATGQNPMLGVTYDKCSF